MDRESLREELLEDVQRGERTQREVCSWMMVLAMHDLRIIDKSVVYDVHLLIAWKTLFPMRGKASG